MKATLIATGIALVIGFAGGWVTKSASAELDSFSPARTQPVIQRPEPAPRPPDTALPRPEPNAFSPEPKAPRRTPRSPATEVKDPEVAETLDSAKWTRLVEVLGITPDQAQTLEARLAQALPSEPGGNATEELAKTGAKLEAEILSVLAPEQQEAFKELQERDRVRRVENLAQEAYLATLSELDLTPEQRAGSLEILRQNSREQLDGIPDSTRLVLSGSFLPIGNEGISDQGLIFLSKLKAAGHGNGSQPGVQEVAALHRREIATHMNQFEDVLTPGQLARYQQGLQKSLQNLDVMAPLK